MRKAAVFAFFLLTGGLLFGDEPGEVEQRIKDLEERVQRLERIADEQLGIADNGPGEGWQSLNNWSRIERGMSYDQVINLLGYPTDTVMFSSDSGTWFYEGHVDAAGTSVTGRVSFINRRVLGIFPPVW
jgi:hypothetical protein